MNPLYVVWMAFFASECSSQMRHGLNMDSENVARHDTYSYTRTRELKYIWAIHNFSDHEKLGTGEILSPRLREPGTTAEWFIKVTLHGTDKKNEAISVEVYLSYFYSYLKESAKYAISIINNEKKLLWSRNSPNFMQFKPGSGNGWPDFCKKNDFFRNQLLQNDTLMLLIHITMLSELSSENYGQKTAETLPRCDTYLQKQIDEVKYIWAIHNFTNHEINGIGEIESSRFEAPKNDRHYWRIKIYPNDIGDVKDTIALEVRHLCSFGPNLVGIESAEINVSMINDKKEALISANTTFDEPGDFSEKVWSPFCTKDDFFRNRVLQNDILTLSVTMKWIFPHTHVISSLHKTSTPRPAPRTTLITSTSTENFESMLENPKLADVIFAINGSKYPAHSKILAARSPVLATMLYRKYVKSEKLKKIRINVTHMNEEVLRAMLRYIYTGKCENLSKLADQLLVAAVKYGLDGLRQICEEERSKTLMD
ncbi:speckle-type POZ protein-like [Planococcus citri]|uniref:speckle-type POZ protein-like n=1 Tax=Planococcus citri TaxID=170843 RepID=UPI0031F9B01E